MPQIEISEADYAALKRGRDIVIKGEGLWSVNRRSNYNYYFIDDIGRPQLEVEHRRWVDERHAELGNYFHTEADAAIASSKIRSALLLMNYVLEFDKDWEPDWRGTQDKYYVFYNHGAKQYDYTCTGKFMVVGAVYMSLNCAVNLTAKLNSGKVVL